LIQKYKHKIDFCFDLGNGVGMDNVLHCVVLSHQNNIKSNSKLIEIDDFQMEMKDYIDVLFWSELVFDFINNSNMWHQVVYGFRHIVQERMFCIVEELKKENNPEKLKIFDFGHWNFIFVECENVPEKFKDLFFKIKKHDKQIYKVNLT